MGIPAEEIRISLTLSVDDVHWPQVLELLGKRQRLSFQQSDALLRNFLNRLLRPLNLYWFTHSELSKDDNRLLSAICECHGADTVNLTVQRPFRAGPLRLNYLQRIQFQPNLRSTDAANPGRSRPDVSIALFGREIKIRSAVQAILLQTLLFGLGIAFYVVVMGALLYSLAVFLLFLEQPFGVTQAATTNAVVGLALLCFLVASSAIFGRAVSNVTKALYEKFRPTKRAPVRGLKRGEML